jgi:hypothetical protein
VKNNSERVGLNLNIKKTVVMGNVDKVNIFSDGADSSTVTNCMFWWLTSPITATPLSGSRKK